MQIGERIRFSRAGGSLERKGLESDDDPRGGPSYIQGTWRINTVATGVRFVFPPRGRWHSIGHRACRNDFNPPGLLGARGRSSCIRSSKILLHAEVATTQKRERKENGGLKRGKERGSEKEDSLGRVHAEGSEWEKALCNCNPDKYPEPRRTTNEQREVRERDRQRGRGREGRKG